MLTTNKLSCSMRGLLNTSGRSLRLLPKVSFSLRPAAAPDEHEDETSSIYPRKIFSGIQPTGSLHLGNYLGAVRRWTKLQNSREDVTFCIADLHSITVPQEPYMLREQIFEMAATMLACGIDIDQSTLFVQSAVKEHTELAWILGCVTTMGRLGRLPQYAQKTRLLKSIPLGLFVYPVLQAADILLHKGTHVPVGEDQLHHIQLAQHLAQKFNDEYGVTFPKPHAMIDSKEGSRIRSLRDPGKKMSKSDPDKLATIYILDEPEIIVDKIKKSVTDHISDITYDDVRRPGVANLIVIHSLVSGWPVDKIVDEASSCNTETYKMRVADAVIAHLKPIRTKVIEQMVRKHELIYLLDNGAEKARRFAQETIAEVKQKTGLGALQTPVLKKREDEGQSSLKAKKAAGSVIAKTKQNVVPKIHRQQMRAQAMKQYMKLEKMSAKHDDDTESLTKFDIRQESKLAGLQVRNVKLSEQMRQAQSSNHGKFMKPVYKFEGLKPVNQKTQNWQKPETKHPGFKLDLLSPFNQSKESYISPISKKPNMLIEQMNQKIEASKQNGLLSEHMKPNIPKSKQRSLLSEYMKPRIPKIELGAKRKQKSSQSEQTKSVISKENVGHSSKLMQPHLPSEHTKPVIPKEKVGPSSKSMQPHLPSEHTKQVIPKEELRTSSKSMQPTQLSEHTKAGTSRVKPETRSQSKQSNSSLTEKITPGSTVEPETSTKPKESSSLTDYMQPKTPTVKPDTYSEIEDEEPTLFSAPLIIMEETEDDQETSQPESTETLLLLPPPLDENEDDQTDPKNKSDQPDGEPAAHSDDKKIVKKN